jgi:hypothetical protein
MGFVESDQSLLCLSRVFGAFDSAGRQKGKRGQDDTGPEPVSRALCSAISKEKHAAHL